MGSIVVLIFAGVFAVVTLLLIAHGTLASQKARQALAALDSALATGGPEARDQQPNLLKNEQLSGIPWLNRKLLKLELAPRLYTLLRQADLKWTAGGLLTGCGLCFMLPAYLVYQRFDSFALALLVGAAVGCTPFMWVLSKRSKRFSRFEQGLPEALDLMVSGLRAGHSLIAAIGLVARECPAPVGSEFQACFEEQKYGLELKTALDHMVTRMPVQDLRIISTAIMIQNESGGNLAEVLDKTSNVIRERFRLKRQVAVHTAQGRLTGWVLTLLPIGLGFALFTVNPAMMSILWTTAIGVKLLWAAGGMLILGGLIIRSIVNMDV
jgi:tight adherence protein B